MYVNLMRENIIYSMKKPNGFFDINLAGITNPNPDYVVERGKATFYVFEYVLSGKGYIDTEGQHIEVTAGDFYYLNCSAPYVKYYPDEKTPYKKLWVNACGSLLDAVIPIYELDGAVFVLRCDVRRYFERIFELLSATSEGDSAWQETSAVLIALLNRVTGSRIERAGGERKNYAVDIKNYIDTHIYEAITLDDIASGVFISKNHVLRCFKSQFGTSPMQYAHERKIDIAKQLLKGSQMQIKEIAARLNFTNAQHFSTSFLKYTGTSPSEFRNA